MTRTTRYRSRTGAQWVERVKRIFDRFARVFPDHWERRFKDDSDSLKAQRDWVEAFIRAEVSDNTLIRVLAYLCDESGRDSPPTLPEFMALCRQLRVEVPPTFEALPAPYEGGLGDYVEQVLAPNARSEVAQRELARIRAILKRPPPANREERRERTDAAMGELQAQLEAAARRGRLKVVTADSEHRCAYLGCQNAGTRSHALAGGGVWYCQEHFRDR